MALIRERLVERRKNKGLTQEGLAEIVRISVPTIARMENGRSDPKSEELSRLAFALDTSVAYLIGETDEPVPVGKIIIQGHRTIPMGISLGGSVTITKEGDMPADKADDSPFMRLERNILEETRQLEEMSRAHLAGEYMGKTSDPSPPGHPKGENGDPPMTDFARDSSQKEQSKSGRDEVVSNVAPINPAHMIRVRILDKMFKVCCGSGIDWGSEAVEFTEAIWLPLPDLARRYSNDDLIGTYAEGDSMEPKIGDGDLVIFVPHEKEILFAGIIMVVSYNGRMMIRGLVQNSRLVITLKALNSDYEDIVVTPDDEFCIHGRAIRRFVVDQLGSIF
jgi:transcriptional regulator with XRE-family HTH domain